ncbi:outer membrane protein assembly factor BamB family protein [Natronorubrum sp. FCH18a]|uniref:PQQ-like beta-propeller repeat protein n=1 Tax=Natronorubrum sp. FCH18a TaxID=3447018 RepID=UPI003F513B6F
MYSRRSVLAAGAATGLAAVAGCLSSGHSFGTLETDPDTWRLSGYDLRNTASNADATVPDDPEERWRFEPESPVRSVNGLAVGEDVVVAGSERDANTSLVVLERETGDVLWETEDENADVSEIALGGETVYAASADRYVAAYDLETGERRWDDGEESSSRSHVPRRRTLLFDGETLYRGTESALTAYDGESGDERWRLSGYGASAIDGDRLFRGSATITAYESPTSSLGLGDDELEPVWEASGSGTRQLPVVWDGRVLSGAEYWFEGSERLQAYDADGGDLEWTHEFPETYVTSPVIVDDRAIFHVGRGGWNDTPDGPGTLLAVDADGEVDWEIETEWVVPVLAAAGGTLFAGGEPDAPALAAIDPETGETHWERGVRGDTVRLAGATSLAAVDGLLVVGTEHGHVVTYG